MTIKTGDSHRLNILSGVSTIVTETADQIQQTGKPLPKGLMIYNTDTRELKVSDGVRTPGELLDHTHNAYSPVIHTHLFGTNIPWHLGNPKLWYTDDLVNHPELIALDGSEITDAEAEKLSLVYPGSKLITEKVTSLTGNGYENNFLSMTVDASVGDYFGGNIFNDELTMSNAFKTTDQWLTGDTNTTKEHTVTIAFKGGLSYRPTEYWIVPAASTATQMYALRPTPNSWVLEGSNGNDSWVTIDSRSGYTSWEPFKAEVFTINSLELFTNLRLRITSWNAGDTISEDINSTESLYTGLRRLWIFGRKQNTFSLPNIESPHPSFSWVVPKQELNTGLKHEDVGDIGTTTILAQMLPSYRMPTDGRTLNITDYDLLFASIGHRYDTELTINNATASDGSIEDGVWTPANSDPDVGAYVDYTFSAATCVGKYSISLGTNAAPKSWTLEGYNGSEWVVIQSVTDASASNFTEANKTGTFYVDTDDATTETAYTQYRITFISWNTDAATLGYTQVKFYGHDAGKFRIPTIDSTDETTTYIVVNNTADDVSADIIQRLQKNVSDLSSALSELQNQVNELDPNIDTVIDGQ